MPPIEVERLLITNALTGVLIWAAVSDIRLRKIPNRTVVFVVGLFVLWAIAGQGAGLISALEAAAIAFIVTTSLYAFKVLGAGDAKLFSAAALFAGLNHLALFALVTTLVGGAIAVASLARNPTRALVMFTLKGNGDYGRGVPYGVAIAIGAATVVWAVMGEDLQLPWALALHQALPGWGF